MSAARAGVATGHVDRPRGYTALLTSAQANRQRAAELSQLAQQVGLNVSRWLVRLLKLFLKPFVWDHTHRCNSDGRPICGIPAPHFVDAPQNPIPICGPKPVG